MENQEAKATESAGTDGWRKRRRWQLIVGGTIVAIVVTLWLVATSGRYESTDDSSIKAAQTSISANIGGRVIEINVHENQPVHKGEALFRLDSQPLQIAVAAAEAKLAMARLQISAGKASYRQQLAGAGAAHGTVAYDETRLDLETRMYHAGISSRVNYDRMKHDKELAEAELAAARQKVDSAVFLLGGNPSLPVEQHPAVLEAQAALDQAKLNLSYATVRAPDDGIVTKVEQLHVGNYIPAALEVFTLVSTREVWVDANFKEDQLEYMRPGQLAEIRVDAYSGRAFKARVASLSPGTGSQFSALPAENANGNWVKVVQRLPVRVEFIDWTADMAATLHAGLSADVTVDTQHHHALFGTGDR